MIAAGCRGTERCTPSARRTCRQCTTAALPSGTWLHNRARSAAQACQGASVRGATGWVARRCAATGAAGVAAAYSGVAATSSASSSWQSTAVPNNEPHQHSQQNGGCQELHPGTPTQKQQPLSSDAAHLCQRVVELHIPEGGSDHGVHAVAAAQVENFVPVGQRGGWWGVVRHPGKAHAPSTQSSRQNGASRAGLVTPPQRARQHAAAWVHRVAAGRMGHAPCHGMACAPPPVVLQAARDALIPANRVGRPAGMGAEAESQVGITAPALPGR